VAEIADREGVAEGTVKSWLPRGLAAGTAAAALVAGALTVGNSTTWFDGTQRPVQVSGSNDTNQQGEAGRAAQDTKDVLTGRKRQTGTANGARAVAAVGPGGIAITTEPNQSGDQGRTHMLKVEQRTISRVVRMACAGPGTVQVRVWQDGNDLLNDTIACDGDTPGVHRSTVTTQSAYGEYLAVTIVPDAEALDRAGFGFSVTPDS
jgi:hypothetical protein